MSESHHEPGINNTKLLGISLTIHLQASQNTSDNLQEVYCWYYYCCCECFTPHRAAGQLFFESMVQVIIQFGLFNFGWFESDESDGSDDGSELGLSQTGILFSVVAAVCNCIAQMWRIGIEAKACKEPFVDYAINCLLARIGWIVFQREIEQILNSEKKRYLPLQYIENSKINRTFAGDIPIIDFNIRYDYPCGFSKIAGKGTVRFDFTSLTIRLSHNI